MIYLLHQTVLESAARHPDKEAFVCGRDRLTFGEAATKIRQLAATLTGLGVERGDRVGVYLNRSIETAIGLHGIMLAGAAYVPLDPKASAERIAFQIEDCGIRTIVTNQAQQRNWARAQVRGEGLESVVGLDDAPDGLKTVSWAEVFAAPTDFAPAFAPVESDLAYIMYTSGSTGRPKGIMHTHRSGLAFAQLAVATHDLRPDDVFGNHAPIYFDVSTLAYFAAPLLGATAVIASDGHTLFPASLAKMIADERISVWYSVPLALTQLLQSQSLDKLDLSALRHVFYAGEPFAPKYIRQWRATVPHARLTNWYGPAETNVCTVYDITEDPVGDEHVPIGRTWGNTAFIVEPVEGPHPPAPSPGERGGRGSSLRSSPAALGAATKPLSPGEGLGRGQKGQLLIRSATTMAGYWNRPDLTAAAFYDHPNPSGLPHRFYRTGDLVREDAAGNLHFLGRADNQVKVRGYRIELDAVEERLLAHPDVAEAVVLALPDEDGTLGLRAFIIPAASQELQAKALKAFAGETLPWYAVPQEVVFMATLPRTGSGKISRPALREQFFADQDTSK